MTKEERRQNLRDWQEKHNLEVDSADDMESEEEIQKKEAEMARFLL